MISLFKGLYHLMRDEDGSKRILTSLTWRISLSVSLIVLLILGYTLGWITPHGII